MSPSTAPTAHRVTPPPGRQRSWSGQMISPDCDPGVDGRGCFVATEFELDTPPEQAELHLSALGLYRAYINGARVGQDALTPGLTCYDDRLAYQSYDVAALLQPGTNRLEIWLGDGWYRSQIMWEATKIDNCWGDRIGAIADLVIDGGTWLSTDTRWVAGLLPVMRSGIYYGEDYDARHEALEDAHGVDLLDFDVGKLIAHETAPVREMEPLKPVDQWMEGDARIIDFGQNCSAYVQMTVEGEAGAQVYIDHAEILGPDKTFDRRNYRKARAALQYTLKGTGVECYKPQFTFMGFRYARIQTRGRVEVRDVVSIPVTSVPEQAGDFSCGVESVNRLVLNTIWSQRSNFIEIPTDCPQRDERLGWTGDAQVFAGTACWLADAHRFLAKYLRDVMHDQRDNGAIPHFSPDPTRLHPEGFDGDWAGSTGWGDVITIIPWQLYLHYGDAAVLEECFPAMQRWIDYLWSLSDGPIIRPDPHWGHRGFTFGDWLQPVGDNRKPRPTIADDCAATLYHFISMDLTARIAGILGHETEAAALTERAGVIREAFIHEYFTPAGRLAHNDQTSYALAFLYGLVPDQYYDNARHYFRQVVEDADCLIGTGFIGTPALLPALTLVGLDDLAERVFLNRKVPGWLYQVEQGATTIWERWDAVAPDGTIYDPDMNSYNHYAYGAVCQWLFESVAGVRPCTSHPGYDRVVINPTILPKLSPVSMWHTCRHGRIGVQWKLEGREVTYQVDLPPGVEGLLVPDARYEHYRIDERALTLSGAGTVVPTGRHVITFKMKP